MTITKSTPRLPLHTCTDLHNKLKFDYEELKKDWSEYRTFNFVVTAYHLYSDWIGKVGTSMAQDKKARLPDQAKKLFNVWRDITNATKHWDLNPPSQSRQVVDSVSQPKIADWHAYFVTGPVIYVDVAGARLSLPQLAHTTMDCFEWLLDDSTLEFPTDLTNALEIIFRPL